MRRQKTFLLKLWSDASGEESWRVSLTDVQSKDKRYFADLDALATELAELTREPEAGPDESD